MAVPSGVSCLLSATLSVLMFAGMQMYKTQLGSTQLFTILGGFLGHVLFMLILTSVGNLESLVFGANFKTQLLPEVVTCLAIAMFASGLVHRVCVTTCLIFSLVALYYINNISNAIYAPAVQPNVAPLKSKSGKKRN